MIRRPKSAAGGAPERVTLRGKADRVKAYLSGSRTSAKYSRWLPIMQYTAWVADAPLRDRPLVSVVMATRNRAELLPGAVESLLEQSYRNWELLAVLDGCTDESRAVLEGFGDPRIKIRETEGLGAAAARNLGLDDALGDVVAFLDDDNAMAHHWLRALAECFSSRPNVHAVFGAQLRRNDPDRPDDLSLLFWSRFDRAQLLRQNYIDLGAAAFRRGTPELRFDEQLRALIDWEMLIRVSEHHDLLPLPVMASLYMSDAAGRISRRADVHDISDGVRTRFGVAPLRRPDGGAAAHDAP